MHKSGVIPNYIKAKSEKRLRLLMLASNLKDGITYKYFDIQYVKGSWYAWYYAEINQHNISELEGN